jgi:signal transduction histidine kinase
MKRIITVLKNIRKKDDLYGIPQWHFLKELETSLLIIEDLDQITRNFLGKIREIIPMKKQLLLIYDQDLRKFKVSDFFGFADEEIRGVFFFPDGSLAKWLKVNNTYFSVKEHPGVFDFLKDEEKAIFRRFNFEVCFPLISMNRLIGMIFLSAKESGQDFGKQEFTLISSIAPQIGIALENALLYKEQRERFRRMSRADKLATLGELAAGAAHEIRNPLTAIKSSLQYLESKNQREIEKTLLRSSIQEAERIEKILSALLSFSKPAEIKKEKSDLVQILAECLELLSFQAKKQKVRVITEFRSSSFFIWGDRAQLKQLFLNLLFNSLQAMNEGGELRVGISRQTEKVLVVISDNGEGIAEENLDKIFDPFFTTKKGGTGLGLSVCYGIIKSHQGEIEIKSKVNVGTTAVVRFPLHG